MFGDTETTVSNRFGDLELLGGRRVWTLQQLERSDPGLFTAISVVIAWMAVLNARRLQKRQWERDETNLRRDVLRRLFAYRYRLTESLKGGDGEPFIALNEAWIAYASFPHVTKALTKVHRELGMEGRVKSQYSGSCKGDGRCCGHFPPGPGR